MGEQRDPIPPGTLDMLILKTVARTGRLHGFEIAEAIRQSSADIFLVEEGSLYPALQRILMEGWVAANWGRSESGRRVRFYQLTPDGLKRLKRERNEYAQATAAIQAILRLA